MSQSRSSVTDLMFAIDAMRHTRDRKLTDIDKFQAEIQVRGWHSVVDSDNWDIFLYGLFIHMRFSQCIPGKLSRWRLPPTVLDTLYCLEMTPLSDYRDADRRRPRTRNTRPSNAQCTNISTNESPTFSTRTSILLLALSSWLQTGTIQRDTLARKRQWRRYVNG